MISIQRSETPPDSLATGRYDGDDIRAQLHEDFLGKCYLCERELYGSWQVEHFRPKSGRYESLRTEWSNLFPADSCNQCRKTWPTAEREDADTAFPKGGLLDPSDPTCDLGARLVQRIADLHCVSARHLAFTFGAIDPADDAARNTAAELDHIHHSPKPNGITLRTEIHALLTRVLARLYRIRTEERLGQDPSHHLRELRLLVRRDMPFAGLMRGTLQAEAPDILERVLAL